MTFDQRTALQNLTHRNYLFDPEEGMKVRENKRLFGKTSVHIPSGISHPNCNSGALPKQYYNSPLVPHINICHSKRMYIYVLGPQLQYF